MSKMTHTIERPAAVHGIGAGALGSLSGAIIGIVETALEWQRRAEDRRRLRHMDPHLLRDMGVTPEDAQTEADKPFWVR